MHGGRCDGFCTGAGLVNKVRRRQRDGSRLAGFERRGCGHIPVRLLGSPPFAFLQPFACLFFSQASLPPFLPLFSFHKAGAGSLRLTMSIEHWGCLKAVGSGLGTTPQVLSSDRLALLIQAWAWHQGVSTERGKKGEDFLHLESPPGRDMPSSSGSRNSVRGFLLFCSLSAGALQRAVLRGGEDQR